mmetsp:Transcript_90778/g.290949  ORF Transcript_90778/g.290949 Transcript_90778/m.290949 type:complete len:240 (+) Transcript_90778:2122-2841(+)
MPPRRPGAWPGPRPSPLAPAAASPCQNTTPATPRGAARARAPQRCRRRCRRRGFPGGPRGARSCPGRGSRWMTPMPIVCGRSRIFRPASPNWRSAGRPCKSCEASCRSSLFVRLQGHSRTLQALHWVLLAQSSRWVTRWVCRTAAQIASGSQPFSACGTHRDSQRRFRARSAHPLEAWWALWLGSSTPCSSPRRREWCPRRPSRTSAGRPWRSCPPPMAARSWCRSSSIGSASRTPTSS